MLVLLKFGYRLVVFLKCFRFQILSVDQVEFMILLLRSDFLCWVMLTMNLFLWRQYSRGFRFNGPLGVGPVFVSSLWSPLAAAE